jgi:hypothetical protein
MHQQGKMGKRWLGPMAVALMAMGAVALGAGTAAAGTVPTHAILTFSDDTGQVTLAIPPSRCPGGRTTCQWMLYVDEPNTPSGGLVGTAVGTSGILTVAYPKDVCNLQADVLIGPPPWRFERGMQHTVQAGGTCVPTNGPNQGPTLSPSSQLPFTGPTSDGPASPASLLAADHPAQLPFTGLDVRPLAALGSLMVLLGLVLMTTLEQRRRSLLGVADAMRPRSVAHATGRAARWLLGE